MKIVLSGVETHNKGAELMLYAILQEIERRYPDAKVYLPFSRNKKKKGYVTTLLDFRPTPFSKFVSKCRLNGVFYYLRLPKTILYSTNIVRGADWFIDGSGFAFSDQWGINDESITKWHCMLSALYKDNCKIVFLPQAFGPAEKNNTKRILSVLNKYSDVIMPREKISYDYLERSGVIDMRKAKIFTDFTSLVEGKFPSKYEHLRNGICVIPNMRMIDKGAISFESYIQMLTSIINEGKSRGHIVYLLNHEGTKDEQLAYRCQKNIASEIEVVTGLNALEVKGLISSAYLVVTSRFHGLASALNSGVPSLATSWSHKYEELFKDYELPNCVLPIDDITKAVEKVALFLDKEKNNDIRNHLSLQVHKIKDQTKDMWNLIWNLPESMSNGSV